MFFYERGNIKSPFTNTSRKQFKNELKHFIVNMGSNKIYHYTNVFDVNFLIFKFKKYKQIYIIGPYMEQRPNERRCNELLQQANIKISKQCSFVPASCANIPFK